jgi:nucleotide-binding universal stress UspA family protein
MFERIVVTLDESAAALQALPRATSLAKATGVRIAVFLVTVRHMWVC